MKNVYLLLLIVFLSSNLFAQNSQDTIWFNKKWKVISEKDTASFYRVKPVLNNGLYHFVDYYKNGNIQMDAYSLDSVKSKFDGKAVWYSENGEVEKEANYKNNRLHGKYLKTVNGKKYNSVYKNGRAYSGTTCYEYTNSISVVEYKNSFEIARKNYFKDPNNQLRDEFFYAIKDTAISKNQPYLKKFYTEKGNLIGELKNDYNKKNGIEVYYNYRNNNFYRIDYYENGEYSRSDSYYKSGKPRMISSRKNELLQKYYSETGELLDTLIYMGKKPYNGVFYEYRSYYSGDKEGYVSSKIYYKNGSKIKKVDYHKKNILKEINEFEENTLNKRSKISYDTAGVKIAELTYKNNKPYSGLEIYYKTKKWYDKSKIIKEIEYYKKDLVAIFKIKEGDKIKYFSENKQILGVLKIDTTNFWEKPIEGKKYTLGSDRIEKIIEYKDGIELKETIFRKNKDKYLKRITYNKKQKNYSYAQRVKQVDYYSNNKIQSVYSYKNGYTKLKGYFYDKKGKLLSIYDYETENGKEYSFYSFSDDIEFIREKELGNQITEKYYKKIYNKKNYKEYTLTLVRDINVNGKAYFYGDAGNLLFETEFKNKKPYNGILYNDEKSESFTFLNGEKNGAYKKYRYSGLNYPPIETGNYLNDKKEGVFNYYKYNGKLKKTETYANGLLDGESRFYKEDSLISVLVYKKGEPFEGKFTEINYREKDLEKVYKNGKLLFEKKYSEDGDQELRYTDEEIFVEVYYPNSKNIKYTYKTTLDKYSIIGEVVRYNSAGKRQNIAYVNGSDFESGELLIKAPYYSSTLKDVKYYKLIKTQDLYSIEIYDKNDKLLYKAEERTDLENSLINKNFYTKYIEIRNFY